MSAGVTDVDRTEVFAITAPPSRTERLPRIRRALARGGASRPRGPRPPRPRRSRLPLPGPRPKAPRDGRWWAGVAVLTASVLLLSFVVHAVALSAFQHYRAQTLAYEDLRDGLAVGTTPVGQLVSTDAGDEMPLLGTPVALLEAPSIGLSEVVLEGSTGEVLRSGIGHRRDSVMPGQAGTATILGRQSTYGGPFAQLYRLQPGDEITVTTGQGQSTFRVLGLRRAGDPEPPAVAAGAGRLELQTADGLALFPSGVLHVDAELVTAAQLTPSRVMGYPALPVEERAMGQQTDAWSLAFFFFVFLAAASAGVVWLWRTWGRWQAWLIGLPVVLALGVATADVVMDALPNLL